MSVLHLQRMTWEEARDLDRRRAVFVLPVGAVEAHGPHLPLGTDVVISEAMARAGAERLAAAGRIPVLLPALHYTAAPFAAAFPGTLSVPAETVTGTIVGIARALESHGFGLLALANSHLDPVHLASLQEAVDACKVSGRIRIVLPDLTRKPWALRLGDEFRSGACHAGRYESSVVMAETPEDVRDDRRAALPANPASLSVAIRDGKSTFAEAGGPQAYFGDPAAATAHEGHATVETLGAILAEAVLQAGP
jgi:creatinine amidohydrolase